MLGDDQELEPFFPLFIYYTYIWDKLGGTKTNFHQKMQAALYFNIYASI